MHDDIKRIQKQTNYDKIITKHEWMIAAISVLDNANHENLVDENP